MSSPNQHLWPIHPHPQPDELLSSWMVRIAQANHFKVHSFYSMYVGNQHAIWNRDIDKLAPDWLLQALSLHTGQSLVTIEKTTLRAYESIVFERLNPFGSSKWITPLGIYHRVRRNYGTQYCSLCLMEDGENPYFRKQWRLAFYTTCDRHKLLLRDRWVIPPINNRF